MRVLITLLLLANLLAGEPRRSEPPRLRATLWSESGEALRADELVVKAGGQPVPIGRLLGPSDDLLVLLVMDLVGDLSEIDLARDALADAVAGTSRNTYVGVLRAQDGLKVLLDPTGDHNAVANAIRNAPVTGTPGLLETIETAAELADSILVDEPIRVAVFYVTDSEIDEYREDFTNPVVNRSDRGDMSRRFPEGLIRDRVSRLDGKLAATQSPIFVVHLEYRTGRLDEAYQAGILQLATTTGGDATFCRSNSEIAGAIQAMMRKITAHHSTELRLPPLSGDTVDLSMESETGGLLYRSRYRLRAAKPSGRPAK